MAGIHWTPEEVDDVRVMDYPAFVEKYGPDRRTSEAFRKKKERLPAIPVEFVDKAVGTFNWREATSHLAGMQRLARAASSSQDAATIRIDTDKPIGIIFLSDTHIGDWSTDHDLLERITDEILSIPNLYVALLGDMAAMNIKMRGVAEVAGNLLPPELQVAFYESWLEEMRERVLLSTWDNHAIEREEQGSGISAFRALQSKYVPYFNGIGHPDVIVGSETYKMAVSHRFRGRSVINACAGPAKYLVNEAHDREIAAQGDSHVPGIYTFTHGASTKLAINSGTTQLYSTYARRHFSLTTHDAFPVLELHPDRHMWIPYWSIDAWQASKQ